MTPTASDWQPPNKPYPERGHRRVVCAACISGNGVIVVSPRHGDTLCRAGFAQIGERPLTGPGQQGFIDQWGRFMDRKEAWRVAEAAGQILYEVSSPGTLYSENLY